MHLTVCSNKWQAYWWSSPLSFCLYVFLIFFFDEHRYLCHENVIEGEKVNSDIHIWRDLRCVKCSTDNTDPSSSRGTVLLSCKTASFNDNWVGFLFWNVMLRCFFQLHETDLQISDLETLRLKIAPERMFKIQKPKNKF